MPIFMDCPGAMFALAASQAKESDAWSPTSMGCDASAAVSGSPLASVRVSVGEDMAMAALTSAFDGVMNAVSAVTRMMITPAIKVRVPIGLRDEWAIMTPSVEAILSPLGKRVVSRWHV